MPSLDEISTVVPPIPLFCQAEKTPGAAAPSGPVTDTSSMRVCAAWPKLRGSSGSQGA